MTNPMSTEHKHFDPFIFMYRFSVNRDLKNINEYYDRVESFFDEEKDRIDKEFEEQVAKINQLGLQEKQELIENFGWELSSSQSDFPSLLRSSAIITIYNLIEHYLNKICMHYERRNISKIKLRDLSGQGVKKSKLYLTKVVEIDFDKLNSEWSFVKNLNQLRNHIVHNGSILPVDGNHKINKFIQQNPELAGTPGQELEVLQGFIHHTIDELIKFFDKLFQAIAGNFT